MRGAEKGDKSESWKKKKLLGRNLGKKEGKISNGRKEGTEFVKRGRKE